MDTRRLWLLELLTEPKMNYSCLMQNEAFIITLWGFFNMSTSIEEIKCIQFLEVLTLRCIVSKFNRNILGKCKLSNCVDQISFYISKCICLDCINWTVVKTQRFLFQPLVFFWRIPCFLLFLLQNFIKWNPCYIINYFKGKYTFLLKILTSLSPKSKSTNHCLSLS